MEKHSARFRKSSICKGIEGRDNQMGLYDRELEGTDDIFNAVKEIVDKGNLGNKIEVVRMFSAAKQIGRASCRERV